jgi:8-oxo-dGTP diphosphatase
MVPGGAVEFGESLPQAVRRELKEETGFGVSVGPLRSIHEFIEPPFHALEYYFQAFVTKPELIGAQQLVSQDPRILKIEWVALKDFTNYPLEPSYLITLIQNLSENPNMIQESILFHQTRNSASEL